MTVNSKIDLHGIITPLVTPLLSNNELDERGLGKLINHVLVGGVNGIFILGTTGEFSRLKSKVKEDIIKTTCRIVKKRVPVLVGITDTSMHESIRLAEIAYNESANAVVLAPPYYYSVDQAELLNYYKQISETIELPLFLYNIPARTNINIDVSTVVEASKLPGIVGVKDSSGDLFYFHKLKYALRDNPDFMVFVGPEEIMAPTVLFGASGGVNGGANIFPELFVKLYNAAKSKDFETIYKLQDVVTRISGSLYQVGKNSPNYIKILKSVLSQMDICDEHMAEPFIPFTQEEQIKIENYLNEIKHFDFRQNV